MDQKLRSQLSLISEETIGNKFLNIISKDQLSDLMDAYYIIATIAEINSETILPRWFTASFDHIVTLFVNIHSNGTSARINEFIAAFLFSKSNSLNGDGLLHSLPVLLSWYEVRYVLNTKVDDLNSRNEDVIRSDDFNRLTIELDQKITDFETKKSELEKSLAVINKAVGKIAVKEYAEIFDEQAQEQSMPIEFRLKWPLISLGKAQTWLITGILLLLLLVTLVLNIDSLIDIKADVWTPDVVVHIFSRILLVSLIIFFISFAFKQYRVNMHLYTVNKHRANTLKSFEYLTKAPDKLEAASYNAILMEVAKSIYESGQTGYITTTETNADMPSIIDMTKVITNSK